MAAVDPKHMIVIGVIGGGRCGPEMAEAAEQVGRLVARERAILICGGLSGVMEAACRGAKAEGGMTIGVLPGVEKNAANKHVDIALPTGMSEARNVIIARSADAVIAIDGEYGTLSEIAFALKFGVPVIGLEACYVDKNVIQVQSPAEAVQVAFDFIKNKCT